MSSYISLAASVNVSASQLTNLFQTYLGVSPAKYITKIRLEESRILLSTRQMSIGEIASKLGYSSTAVTTDWEPDELAKMLSTDYLIWTNYEGTAEADHAESCTLLGLSVVERIGLRPDPYFAWLREYAEPEMLLYRPRLYVNASGEAFSAIPEGQAAVMQDYQNAVRDIAYGGNAVFGAERTEGMNETSPAA